MQFADTEKNTLTAFFDCAGSAAERKAKAEESKKAPDVKKEEFKTLGTTRSGKPKLPDRHGAFLSSSQTAAAGARAKQKEKAAPPKQASIRKEPKKTSFAVDEQVLAHFQNDYEQERAVAYILKVLDGGQAYNVQWADGTNAHDTNLPVARVKELPAGARGKKRNKRPKLNAHHKRLKM